MRSWPCHASCGDGLAVQRTAGNVLITARLVVVLVLVGIAGCAIVPRSRMDECQKLTQTLRAENARLKDRVLALQGQNRTMPNAPSTMRERLAIQDEAIERLEHSVQAYQDERTRLEAAYKQLVVEPGCCRARDGDEPARRRATGAWASRAPPASARAPRRLAGTDDDDATLIDRPVVRRTGP